MEYRLNVSGQLTCVIMMIGISAEMSKLHTVDLQKPSAKHRNLSVKLIRVPTAQENGQKVPCQGKHREFRNFAKTQGKLELDRSAKSVLCML